MKKKYKVLSLCLIVVTISVTAICYTMASSFYAEYDFEDENFDWIPLYGNADYEFFNEDNGNTYLKLSYNGKKERGRTYYDVIANSDASTTIYNQLIEASYDVKYSEIETSRNGEIQFKDRIGPGSNETTMVARLAQNVGYFQVQGGTGIGFARLKGLNGQYLPVEVGRWYTIKIVVNLKEHWQSIYVLDRDTGSLLAEYEYFSTINDIDHINMITFSSSTDMCLDNLKISEPVCENYIIYGEPYLKRGTKSSNYFIGQEADGSFTSLPNGTTRWSLVKTKQGVSINETTGRLTAASNAEPGVVVIKAERTVGDTAYEAKYAVNITN